MSLRIISELVRRPQHQGRFCFGNVIVSLGNGDNAIGQKVYGYYYY